MAKRERVRIRVLTEEGLPPTHSRKHSLDGKPLFVPKHGRQGGRKKGSPNKVSALLKDAIMLAAEAEGSDGRGKDGLIGFLRRASRKDLGAYMRLLEKMLPYQFTGKDGGPMKMEHSTKQDVLDRMRERGLPIPPSLIDHEPPTDTIN